jgi:hypothetical protein
MAQLLADDFVDDIRRVCDEHDEARVSNRKFIHIRTGQRVGSNVQLIKIIDDPHCRFSGDGSGGSGTDLDSGDTSGESGHSGVSGCDFTREFRPSTYYPGIVVYWDNECEAIVEGKLTCWICDPNDRKLHKGNYYFGRAMGQFKKQVLFLTDGGMGKSKCQSSLDSGTSGDSGESGDTGGPEVVTSVQCISDGSGGMTSLITYGQLSLDANGNIIVS